MKPITTLKELQDIEINVLKEFVRFCDINNLKYFVSYGTLLGTIRSGGMIPWDDDIDICMPRNDYEKFIELAEKNGITSFIKIDDPSFSIDTWSLIVRVYDARTIITSNDFKIGVFIDIHPLDIFPEQRVLRELWFLWIWGHKMGMIFSYTKIFSASILKFFIKLMLLPLIIVAKMIGFKYFKKMVLKSSKYYTSKNYKSDKIGVLLGDFNFRQIALNKRDFILDEYKLFEGILVSVPKNCENLLELWYGDYLSLPDEADRKAKHEMKAFWL